MNHQNLPTDMNLGYVVEQNTVEIHTDETTSVVENDLTVKLKFKYVIKSLLMSKWDYKVLMNTEFKKISTS